MAHGPPRDLLMRRLERTRNAVLMVLGAGTILFFLSLLIEKQRLAILGAEKAAKEAGTGLKGRPGSV